MTWEEAKKKIDDKINELRKTRPNVDNLKVSYIDFNTNPEVRIKYNEIVILDYF